MAGEIVEPIMLDFKADSLHSGSISFGRFESEVLCWERRSSFSHNRYLEEVEKCSIPGLVTEKKAYFEARFRKKGIPCLGSPESQHDDNDPSEKTSCDEENSHMNVGMNSPQYDESEHQVMERGIELSCDVISNVDIISDPGTVEEAHQVVLESVVPTHSRSEIEVKENLDDTSNVSKVKERTPSQAQHMKTRLLRGVNAAQSLRKEASKGSEKNPSKTVHNVLMRSKAEKKTSQASARDKRPMQKTPKDEPGSKGKGLNVIRRGDKESKNRGIEVPQPSTLRKLPSRVHQSESRIKPAVGVNQACIKQDSSRLSFKCNERAERRKEDKTGTEIKQVRKSLNFKAKPLPSFYRGEPDRNKVLKQPIEPRKLRTKASRTGSRVSDPPQASSGATSCHSTVTSDSTPSSPASEISKGHVLSQAVVNSRVGVKKEKDSIKLLKTIRPTYRGKMMDVKQKNTTEVPKSTLQTRIVQR